MKSKLNLFVIFGLLLSLNIGAKVKLPAILGDNMVLQQQTEVKLWGKSEPNKKIVINPSWSYQEVSVNADAEGNWIAKVNTSAAGGPYKISFNDGVELVLNNIYLGEVWLCSGQSNMEMPMKGFYGQPVLDSNQAVADANPQTPIRMFTVKKEYSKTLKEDVTGKWKEHNSETVANFSATAYFFGKQLYRTLNVPIGLINCSWGAANVETWMPRETLKLYPEISLKHLDSADEGKVNTPQRVPCLLYNAMLYPLRNLKIKGTIWYQGESNRYDPARYKDLFISFVKDLRNLFKQPDMPFYYAQIAPFEYKDNPQAGALVRESQLLCEKLIPNSGMAVLMDIGEEHIIHPSHKEIGSRRLAYLALKNDYGCRGITAVSPRYASKKIEGREIILSFEEAGMGLTSFSEELNGFEIAGADKKFYPAKGKIKGNKVIVSSQKVKAPIAVRYCFKNYIKGNLFGNSGLPVSSFRTDF